MKLPEDSFILLSFVNTKLRDGYHSLESFCEDLGCSPAEICARLEEIGYFYSPESNSFFKA